MAKKAVIQYLMVCLGIICLGVGIVGVFIPLLPTTPFLLLAAFFFLRGSKRLHEWLINHKIFGKYIYNYMKYRAVKRSTKIGAIILLWVSLVISILLVTNFVIELVLLAVGIGVSIHILTLKNLQ